MKIFKEIASAYDKKDSENFSIQISLLIPLFRQLGVVRAYYICIKIQEIEDLIYNSDNKKDDIDRIKGIWFLYPALNESLFEYFAFLDYRCSLYIEKGHSLAHIFISKSKTCFMEIFYSLKFSSEIVPIISSGRCYCIKKSD